MKLVGNLLWLFLAGIWLSIGYVVSGIASCLTIIGIPFGIQSFKLAGYVLWPFGRVVIQRPGASAAAGCVGNVIWFVFGGFWLAVSHVITGIILCITIIGIPFGLVSFRMAGLALAPFGKQVVPAGRVPAGAVILIGAPSALGGG